MSQGNFTSSQKGNRKLEFKDFLYTSFCIEFLSIAGLSWATAALWIAGLSWATAAIWIAWLLKATNALWNSRQFIFVHTFQSIFVPTTPCRPAHIDHTQSLTPQLLCSFVPSTASFVTLQVASNDALIIPPPHQFADALFSHIFADNYWSDSHVLMQTFKDTFDSHSCCNTYSTYSHVPYCIYCTYCTALLYLNVIWLFIT